MGVGAGGVGVGVGVGAGLLLSVHCCDMAALSQLAISIVLPSTLMLPVLSKQRPEAVLRMVLLELSTHFWLALVSVPAVAAVAAVVMLAAAAPAKATKAAANFVRALKRFKNLDRVFVGLVL